jgi:hypothetical protein
MAGITLRYVVYDLLRDFKQLHKDADIKAFQMLYWVLIHADRLRQQHIAKRDSGAYVTRFSVPVEIDQTFNRQRIELPVSIYDFDGDAGVDYMCYSLTGYGTTGAPTTTLAGHPDIDRPQFTIISFTRTSAAKSARLYFREEEEPSPTNPYFYRQGKYLYLLGTEAVSVSEVEVGLKSTFDPTNVSLDIDQPFEFPQELLPVLKRQILDLGRFILQIPNDLINDGTGLQSKQIPTQKLISVNEQPENTE